MSIKCFECHEKNKFKKSAFYIVEIEISQLACEARAECDPGGACEPGSGYFWQALRFSQLTPSSQRHRVSHDLFSPGLGICMHMGRLVYAGGGPRTPPCGALSGGEGPRTPHALRAFPAVLSYCTGQCRYGLRPRSKCIAFQQSRTHKVFMETHKASLDIRDTVEISTIYLHSG